MVADGVEFGSAESFGPARQLAAMFGAEWGARIRWYEKRGSSTVVDAQNHPAQALHRCRYSGTIQHRVGAEDVDLAVAINAERNARTFDLANNVADMIWQVPRPLFARFYRRVASAIVS
nr:hypothetical protein [Bradyrhizobium mercantei]